MIRLQRFSIVCAALACMATFTAAPAGAESFTVPFDGEVYLSPEGGFAAASTKFGLGTAPENFVQVFEGLPNNPSPDAEVLIGTYSAGDVIDFGMFTTFGSSQWAFSTGNDSASLKAFTDTNNSLGFGGNVIEQTGPDTWLMHLDDARTVDDDDNDVLIGIRVVPEPASAILLAAGIACALRRRKA